MSESQSEQTAPYLVLVCSIT